MGNMNFTTWPSFPVTCLLLLITLTKKVVSRQFFIRISLHTPSHFLFWEILNLNLSFAVSVTLNREFTLHVYGKRQIQDDNFSK